MEFVDIAEAVRPPRPCKRNAKRFRNCTAAGAIFVDELVVDLELPGLRRVERLAELAFAFDLAWLGLFEESRVVAEDERNLVQPA